MPISDWQHGSFWRWGTHFAQRIKRNLAILDESSNQDEHNWYRPVVRGNGKFNPCWHTLETDN
jgi:hypothetical protein